MNKPTARYCRLSDMYASRISLWVYCNGEPTVCWRSVEIDLIRTILRYGDLDSQQLRRRLKCDVCGSKDISVSMSATGVPHQPPRELPIEARKRVIAVEHDEGMAAVADDRQEVRDGKPLCR